EVPSEVVRDLVKKEQAKDFAGPKRSEDYPSLNKKEAKWCEKIDDIAFRFGYDLPNSPVSDDSAVDAVPGTPSVKQSPSVHSEEEE
ncbi:hypothetical protein, partial [Salmonella enterica]|uniref:hypothetical protein n=1 Tax=Salmonella enterica TaxID=28901 RepID=UPI0020C3C194